MPRESALLSKMLSPAAVSELHWTKVPAVVIFGCFVGDEEGEWHSWLVGCRRMPMWPIFVLRCSARRPDLSLMLQCKTAQGLAEYVVNCCTKQRWPCLTRQLCDRQCMVPQPNPACLVLLLLLPRCCVPVWCSCITHQHTPQSWRLLLLLASPSHPVCRGPTLRSKRRRWRCSSNSSSIQSTAASYCEWCSVSVQVETGKAKLQAAAALLSCHATVHMMPGLQQAQVQQAA